MQTNEVRMLADHMGHDLNIHSNIYSLQSSVVERAKVAKILLAVEAGKLHKMNETTDLDTITAPEVSSSGEDAYNTFLTIISLTCIV